MFTGIIKEIGIVKNILVRANTTRLSIQTQKIIQDSKVGDSIAVNGVCLTIVDIKADTASFDAVKETTKNTNLGKLRITDKVNLEPALKVGDRLSGHFVMGHIDCLGIIQKKMQIGNTQNVTIKIPIEFSKFLVSKGSICVEGVSLTVQDLKRDNFSIALIPHTLKSSNLALKNVGDKVNLEFDLQGKYILKSKNG